MSAAVPGAVGVGAVRVGAIDCGTNSIRLLIADVDPRAGVLSDVVRRMEVVRLGEGVDRTGVISAAALERASVWAREYARECRDAGVEAVRFVATSASRDARNAADFVALVREAFGDYDVRPEVISGAEEAALSFRGGAGELAAAGFAGPYLVVDLGGGSTEFVRGTDHAEAALSVDVGCVRFHERHLAGDPPTAAERAAALADVDRALDRAEAEVGFTGIATLVGLAGTVTTLTAHTLGLTVYDPERIHLASPSVADTLAAAADLLDRTRDDRAALPFMHPGRADVIGAGALVWARIVERVVAASPDVRLVSSEHDILDGIAWSLADSANPQD